MDAVPLLWKNELLCGFCENKPQIAQLPLFAFKLPFRILAKIKPAAL
jgi:hypothetical protein